MIQFDKNNVKNKFLYNSVNKFRRGKTESKCGLLDSLEDNLSSQDNPAFQHVRDNIADLDGVGAQEIDLIFLKSLLDSPIMRSLVKVQDRLEETLEPIEPISTGNINLSYEISKVCDDINKLDAKELKNILNKPYFKSLLMTHDTIAEKFMQPKQTLAPLAEIDSLDNNLMSNIMAPDAIRILGLRKNPNEPLGLTVEQDDNGNLIVARILAGGMIDKQGLLSKGDVILEVNNVHVSTPEDLIVEVAKSKDSVTLKIAPNDDDTSLVSPLQQNGKIINGFGPANFTSVVYMRALFDYDPLDDTLLPCKEIGLAFSKGDILQIMNQKDPNWWQAKKIGSNGTAGLIPSQELEERRKAFVAPEADYVHKIGICGTRISKKKRKIIYQSKSNSDFDKAELLLYEEVTRMPPFKRKTLVLIGSQGVGRRTLKNRLINSDSDKFGGVIPHTSRPQREYEENGRSYWFMDRDEMEEQIRQHRFLEYGEHNGHLYGTSLDSIRDVMRQGKMCVLDCSPQVLKILHNSSEFMPYVIFIAAPGMEQMKHLYNDGTSTRNLTFDRQSSIRYSSRRARTLESLASLYEEDDLRRSVEESTKMQRAYDKYVDITIVNEDFDITFRQVIQALDVLSTEHQWVPVNWVF